ncbi:unnamed protein product [Echinostoma caproni]|uniref:Bestrophin homolog n=1 Tax=Echinostoma caproni TaxID=27848 RepID=A0A183AEA1_9TREM|nr:unnamed protein product [Echinostoma caproni]
MNRCLGSVIADWFEKLFVGTVRFNVLLFLWDQWFVQQFRFDVFERMSRVLIKLMETDIRRAVTTAELNEPPQSCVIRVTIDYLIAGRLVASRSTLSDSQRYFTGTMTSPKLQLNVTEEDQIEEDLRPENAINVLYFPDERELLFPVSRYISRMLF